MQEKTDWELVDETSSATGSQWRSQAGAPGEAGTAPGIKQLLRAMMGPWWRWKILGAALFTTLAVVMLAMLTGVFALVAAAGAVVAIGIGKLRQWTRRHNGALAP
ncbi:hypothetical protein [Janthinobacterium sp. 17J80-10]|uniref:hypothetical protein n=1 Tax=Janthinobacterium sp. 17J80-10 TaxID=2497863 RepID=UPI00100535DE|nr:hypothetical protein [Janthinobacterium sp. 17J80-10]QAU33467.1 hypothetical protein EKL02_04300 [Janthinobacterium sp. 17J80-10]